MPRAGDIEQQVREYWDLDAATYDRSPGHDPQTRVELAVWAATLRRLLPPPPARVLDAGAGTGFVSLLLAREGYRVTALDLAPSMLAQLSAKAAAPRAQHRDRRGQCSRTAPRRLRRCRRAAPRVDLAGPEGGARGVAPGCAGGDARAPREHLGGARRPFGAAPRSCPGPSPATEERAVGTSCGVRRRPPLRAPVRVGHEPGAAGRAR